MPGISSRGGSSNGFRGCDSGCFGHGRNLHRSASPSNYYAPADDPAILRDSTPSHMLACFSAGDPQGQLDHCADDVVYEAPYYGIERHGKAELAAMLTAVQERFD